MMDGVFMHSPQIPAFGVITIGNLKSPYTKWEGKGEFFIDPK